MSESMISKWLKDSKGNRYGIVVAMLVNENTYNIDYSYCAEGDKFDQKLGVEMAVNRCKKSVGRKGRIKAKLHPEIQMEYMDMVQRASRYFKGCKPSEKVEWVKNHYHYSEAEPMDGYSRGSIMYDNEPTR